LVYNWYVVINVTCIKNTKITLLPDFFPRFRTRGYVQQGKYKTWTPGPWTPHGPGPSNYGPRPWTPGPLFLLKHKQTKTTQQIKGHLKKADVSRFPVCSNEAVQERNSFTVDEQLKDALLLKTMNERTSSEAGTSSAILKQLEDS